MNGEEELKIPGAKECEGAAWLNYSGGSNINVASRLNEKEKVEEIEK